MINWADTEPDFIKPQNVAEIRTLEDALALLDQWEAAHQEAVTAWARQHDAYCKMKWRAENAESLAANYQLLYECTGGARELAEDVTQA